AHYWDAVGGGYFFTADDTADVILRNKTAIDHATPAGNAVMIGVLARLFYLTGKAAYRDRAAATLGAFAGEIGRNFFPLATLINADDFRQNARKGVGAGARAAADPRAMLRAGRAQPRPDLVLPETPPGDALPAGHPAAGKGQSSGGATAY